MFSGFAEQSAAVGEGWSAARYHGDCGESVAEFLSFKAVFGINPFEVGASHSAERRGYNARRGKILEALGLNPFLRRSFASLSNGEMRRVLLARALLKAPPKLVADDVLGAWDGTWRERMGEVVRVAAGLGTELVFRGRSGPPLGKSGCKRAAGAPGTSSAKPVLELEGVNLVFGAKTLYGNLSWTVREGERWLLRGPNGSGKTTLLALVSGDSPLGYAFGIRLFGRKRGEEGVSLMAVRKKIGVVSSENQMYSGMSIEEQLDRALVPETKLLLMDEPCCNLSPAAARKVLRRVSGWLDRNPKVAAIAIAHARNHVPAGFDLELELPS